MAKFISTTTNAEVIYLQETGHRVYRRDGAWLHSETCKQCAAQHSVHPMRGSVAQKGKSKSKGSVKPARR